MNKIESLDSLVDLRLLQRLEELVLDHNRLKVSLTDTCVDTGR